MENNNNFLDSTSLSKNKVKIAFAFRAGSGKDTACAYMQKKYDGIIHRFAEPIYDISKCVQNILDLPVEKDRKLLQILGTGLKEKYGDMVWVNCMEKKIKCATQNIFIADLRFQTEAKMLKSYGFVLVRIIRPIVENSDLAPNTQHISEIDLINYNFDFTIMNDSNIDRFYAKLDELYKEIILKKD